MDKTALISELSAAIREKQESLALMLAELNQAIADDTKSSAGDKFETARAMAQQEIDKVQQQLSESRRQQALLASLPLPTPGIVQSGSVVTTTHGIYFIGIPFGQVNSGGKAVYCISPASPLAQQLIGKQKNDEVKAGTITHSILEVL